ncbi:hypothetical protein ACWT_5336 [Actinoplanes sp. SE50]|uniref:STAS domain-containing protein n=1 Tax=unclassified Actinoplanes TaxID=2626549 RepID=UPI00023EC157|nr:MULTISPECIES: STAS domain-containing protein [unclassified Actinoplanes]AEV86354.1 hypothetical protein ACPL_5467 [Actinoplanes sp. SE50/110]ATO84751.1 hypothetical protein ACWT_5336 [Actinoplanes sp. SE50]SLM02161.1 hypothetical protein ACSP50_5399 [Actinoplanes sp. SE50/110]
MPVEPPLTVFFRHLTADSALLLVQGEVDAGTAGVLTTALNHAVGAYPLVTCDLSGVTFFGAEGAHAIALARARGHAQGHVLELAGAPAIARDVLLIAGLGTMLRISG